MLRLDLIFSNFKQVIKKLNYSNTIKSAFNQKLPQTKDMGFRRFPSRNPGSPSHDSLGVPQLLINYLRNNIFLCLSKELGKPIFVLSSGKAGFPNAQKTSPKAALALLDTL